MRGSIYSGFSTYGLEGVVSFIYHGAIMDVDILSPTFDSGLSEKEADLETIASLLIKHNIEVPSDLRIQQHAVQRRKELRSAIKCFENWLIGHLIYADLDGLVSTPYIILHVWGSL